MHIDIQVSNRLVHNFIVYHHTYPRLYNKEALLLALLDKHNLPDLAKHIRSLKDVVELKLTLNPDYTAVATAEGYSDAQSSEYVCPVTGLEMTGRHRYVA